MIIQWDKIMEARITGKIRYHENFLKKMVLQVEMIDRMEDPIDLSHTGPKYRYWKDATVEDVQQYLSTTQVRMKMKESSSSAAVELLRREADNNDREVAHINADKILCDLLEKLGYTDVVEAFKKVKKWYS